MLAATSPPNACTLLGAEGGWMALALGVTGREGSEGELVPLVFVAVTVNVYSAPLVNPGTLTNPLHHSSSDEMVALSPLDEVTVYDSTGAPPSRIGGFHVT